jgi:hypothetical protein
MSNTRIMLASARADAARALALLDGIAPAEATVPCRGQTEALTRTITTTVPMGSSWYSDTVDDEAALAAASAELRAAAGASPTGRVDGDTVAGIYRRHGVWR